MGFMERLLIAALDQTQDPAELSENSSAQIDNYFHSSHLKSIMNLTKILSHMKKRNSAAMLKPLLSIGKLARRYWSNGTVKPIRGMIFSYGDEFTAPYVDAIYSTLASDSIHLILTETENAHFFSPYRLARYKGCICYISDKGLHTLPTVSSREYISICGDDIDFLAIRSLEFWRSGLPDDSSILDPESSVEQMLRGVALRVEAMLTAVAPDFIVIPHGADPWTKVLTAKARKLLIPCLYWESSFFPGKILIDAKGPHFLPGASQMEIDAIAPPQPISLTDMDSTEEYLQTWLSKRQSKHLQREDPLELEAFEAFRSQFKRVVFVPLQLPHDASVFGNAIFYPDMFSFCRDIVKSIPDGVGIVFKVHPYMHTHRGFNWADFTDIFERPNVLRVSDLSIHSLIPRVDLVTALTSNVGLEAAIYGVPVVVGGSPIYARRGFTFDRNKHNTLRDLFEVAFGAKINREMLLKFIAGLLKYSLIPEGDTQAGSKFLHRALNLYSNKESKRAPFSEFDPPAVKAYVEKHRARRAERT